MTARGTGRTTRQLEALPDQGRTTRQLEALPDQGRTTRQLEALPDQGLYVIARVRETSHIRHLLEKHGLAHKGIRLLTLSDVKHGRARGYNQPLVLDHYALNEADRETMDLVRLHNARFAA